jgi:SulP family sulfate permease
MAAAILAGIFMIILGALKVGKLISYIPNNAMIGFVDALAILIFSAQLEHFVGEGPIMYALVAIGLLVIYLLPKVFTALPSGLVAVVVVTAISMALGNPVRTIGDLGEILASLPVFAIPNVPLNMETFMIILPYSVSLALVGLVETLLTAQVVDEMTDSPSQKNRECVALGVANVVSPLFGGTCGCGMIGQAIANVSAGGRGRLSTFVGGMFLMVLILVLNDLLQQIPLAALVAVMVSVSIRPTRSKRKPSI